ncbi:MAG: right-handed parallel beta-helix repeat-containing protein, partial [Caldilineales bacterium]
MPSVVTDFGTNRDAIVSAIDAAKQGDGVVHFPAGTYEVDRVIDSLADSDGIVLHGEPGSEILIAVKDGSGFRIGGAKNLTINGLDFFSTDDGDAATNALAGLDAAGTPKACSILKIIDCEFHHFKIAPWRFSSVDTDGFWCIRNSIHDIKTDLQVSSDPLLADPDRPASGIPMSHLTNASYIGNEIHDVDAGRHSPGSRGMYLSGGIVSDILIQGNMIVNSGGIKVGRQHPRPGKEARRVMIVGNTLMDCMGAGINLAVSVFEATVVGNTITSSATVPGGWINLGAEGGPVEDIVVTNNVVNLNGSLAGGMVVNNAVRVMVKNNRLLGSSDTPVAFGGVGIRVLGDSDITLAGNEITQGFVNAIRLNRAIDGCTIEGNRIWDIELEGVEVADTDTVAEISDNQIALTHGHTAINLGTTGSDSGSL